MAAAMALLGAVPAGAETLYVAERLRLGLHAEPTDESAVVKTVETGVPLEVVERRENYVQVREPQGAVGWIEGRLLTPDPPARPQLARLQEELSRSRAQTAEAQAQLKKAQAALAEQGLKAKDPAKTADDPAASNTAPVAAKAPPVKPGATDNGARFSYLWLGISFAMLGIGFAAGVRWLRESIRKRSGGMYLRV